MELNDSIGRAVTGLIEEIKKSDEYIRLMEINKEVKSNPDILKKIERTRQIRKQLSGMNEEERESDYAERLEEEYDNLCDITAVHEFSLAELEFCNLYQKAIGRIVNSFDFDLSEIG